MSEQKTETTEAKPKASKRDGGKQVVNAVHADMVHLYTGERITKEGVLVEVDNWIQVQVAAGKLQIGG